MANKLDLVFKKAVNRQYTSASKNWYNELPGIPYKLKGSDIWIESIPSTPPSSTDAMIRVFNQLQLVKDTSVANNGAWLAYDGPDRIGSFIAPRYGQGYTARLFDNSATKKEIPTTDGCGWFWDYETGILTFDNNPSSYGYTATAFYITTWQYIGLTVDDMMKLDNTLGNLIVNPSAQHS